MAPQSIHSLMATRCFEIMDHGTQSRLHAPITMPGLKFNICELSSSYLRNDQVDCPTLEERIAKNISAELRYSALHWFTHVSHATEESPNELMVNLSAMVKRLCYST